MRLVPNSLLGRAALIFTGLLIISQLVWIIVGGLYYVRPLKLEYARELMYTIATARQLIDSTPSATWIAEQGVLKLAPGLTLYRGQPASAPAIAKQIDIVPYLRSIAGRDVDLMVVPADSHVTTWIRFGLDGTQYWLSMSRKREIFAPSLPLLVWLGIAITLSLVGAYVVVGYLNRRLQTVITSVKAIGRGESPGLLEEEGPDEIRELSRGFNQMNEGLNRIESDRRLMIAGVSHDLRTPLARLRVGLELNSENIEPVHLQGMEEDIDQIDAILRQFLDFARDEQEEPRELCDVNAIVDEVCNRYRLTGAVIQKRLSELPPGLVRPHAIKRLVTNLIANAVEYGKDMVGVATARDGNAVILTVYDRGPGIKNRNPEELLRPFARGDESRSGTGSGLGLTVAERIARSHMGSLNIANRPGGGLAAIARLVVYT